MSPTNFTVEKTLNHPDFSPRKALRSPDFATADGQKNMGVKKLRKVEKNSGKQKKGLIILGETWSLRKSAGTFFAKATDPRTILA